ncbi:LRC71 protein, partial [Upupa epops]|nr:LRC71 protein [Upupa epops]
TLSLEGNPLPEPAFHMLMAGDNSFNHISDQGAAAIAEGLRLNRSLLSLSLANNDIGDAGATKLAEVLGPFTLTHAEVVQRRRLLLAKASGWSRTILKVPDGSSEGPSGHHSNIAANKLHPAKLGKAPLKKKVRWGGSPPNTLACVSISPPWGGHKPLPFPTAGGITEGDPARLLLVQPLLEEAREQQGTVVMPGNRALLNLNLSYNRVTERSLGTFVAALEEQQREKRPEVPGQQGLRCLSL